MDAKIIPLSTRQRSTAGSAPKVQEAWSADTIRIARKAHKLSQAELAEALGCRQQTISEWEVGMHVPGNAYQRLLDRYFASFFATDGGEPKEGKVVPAPAGGASKEQALPVTGEITVTRDQLLGAAKYMEMSELGEMKISLHNAQETFAMFGGGPGKAARLLSN